MLEIFLLVIALCVDEFVASIAYGTDRIQIRFKEAAFMNLICALCLGLALGLGTILHALVPESLTKAICFVSLLMLGLVKLLDYSIKKYINRHCNVRKDISFSFSKLKFIVSIYGDPTSADQDHSKILSAKEAVFLALAMSIDSLIAGTLAAFMQVEIWKTVLAAFCVGILAMYAGQMSGRKLASLCKWDLSWMSGVLFLVLAFTKV